MEYEDLVRALKQYLNADTQESAVKQAADLLTSAVKDSLDLEGLALPEEDLTLTRLRVLVLEALEVLTPDCHYHPLTASLRERLDKAIEAAYDTWAREQPEHALGSPEAGPTKGELQRIKALLGLELLVNVGRFGVGLSGSSVVKVEFRIKGQGTRIGALKLVKDLEDFAREYQAHEEAAVSWLKPFCSEVPSYQTPQGDDPGPYPLLAALAFPPADLASHIPSLHDMIVEGRKAARDAAEAVGKSYAAEYQLALGRASEPLTKRQLWLECLAHWQSAADVGAWGTPFFWHEALLPHAAVPCVIDSGELLWNPLYAVTTPGFLEEEQGIFAFTFQHGDLNSNNILLDPAPGSQRFQLIDFEKARTQSAVLDLCWLGLWALRSAHRSASPSFAQWDELPRAIAGATRFQRPSTTDLGNFELGLTILRSLLHELGELSRRKTDEKEAGYLRLRVTEQVSLTMAAAALAMAFYELRALVRGLDRQLENENTFDLSLHRRWAISLFRTSARLLSGHVQQRPSGPSLDLTTSLQQTGFV